MLEQILQECNNWFVRETRRGEFTVTNGRLSLPFLQVGQYFLVAGSVFNDGLHKYPDESMENETFNGCIAALAIPRSVIDLADKVSEWEEKNGGAVAGVYQSESFGGYTYSKATGKNGMPYTWKDAFSGDLAKWRKI